MTPQASDSEKPRDPDASLPLRGIVTRYVLIQALGGIGVGAVTGILWRLFSSTSPSTVVLAVLNLLVSFWFFSLQAHRYPRRYWTHGPLVAVLTGVIVGLIRIPMTSGPLNVPVGVGLTVGSLIAPLIAMSLARLAVGAGTARTSGVGA